MKEEKITIDSVQYHDKTAIVQMFVEAWNAIIMQLKDSVNLHTKINVYTQIRDRMFRSLFKEKEELLSLYNAICETDYENSDDLEIVTLEGAIYLGMKNDLSFIISNNLYLYEHQSTDNANMPLRDLFYIAEQYHVLTAKEDIYSTSQIHLPTPHFVVLYNGKKKKLDKFEYRLSDAYITKEDEYALDLKVTVYNVNKGHNPAMMARCKTLDEFSQFTEILREYNKTMDIRQSVMAAIDYCIDHNILKSYLLRNKAEVVNMVLYDFDLEKYKEDRENEVLTWKSEAEQWKRISQEKEAEIRRLREQLEKMQ